MERVIDRKEYRRNPENETMFSDEKIDTLQKRIKKVLFQSLVASVILLVISFLKFYNNVEMLNKINYQLNSEITVSSLKKSGQIIMKKANQYYTDINNIVDNVLNNNYFTNLSGEKVNDNAFILNKENNIGDTELMDEFVQTDNDVKNNNESFVISGENVIDNKLIIQENKFETAVEGINQMSDDANFINNNYELTIPVIGTITSEFGVRNSTNPIVSHYHSGLDIAANTGTQIVAALEGEVIEAGTDTYYGKYLKIKKDNLIMIYAHCSKLLVKKGDYVKRNSLIAYVGNTGNSTGPHLHFELKYNDRLVDPSDVLDV